MRKSAQNLRQVTGDRQSFDATLQLLLLQLEFDLSELILRLPNQEVHVLLAGEVEGLGVGSRRRLILELRFFGLLALVASPHEAVLFVLDDRFDEMAESLPRSNALIQLVAILVFSLLLLFPGEGVAEEDVWIDHHPAVLLHRELVHCVEEHFSKQRPRQMGKLALVRGRDEIGFGLEEKTREKWLLREEELGEVFDEKRRSDFLPQHIFQEEVQVRGDLVSLAQIIRVFSEHVERLAPPLPLIYSIGSRFFRGRKLL